MLHGRAALSERDAGQLKTVHQSRTLRDQGAVFLCGTHKIRIRNLSKRTKISVTLDIAPQWWYTLTVLLQIIHLVHQQRKADNKT